MPYSPIPYTDQNSVARILRSSKQKIKIGDEENDDISMADVDEYILDAGRFIDSMLMKVLDDGHLPITNYSQYPELGYIAPRLTAFFIYRDLYSAYKIEELPGGPKGWIDDSKDFIKIFTDNLDSGCYPALSSSKDGPSWVTAYQYFQTKIGNSDVHDEIANIEGRDPIQSDNIGPWSE